MLEAENGRVAKLAEEIKAMKPGEQLRLAADLLDTREIDKVKLAHTIVRMVENECAAALLAHSIKLAKEACDAG